MATKSVARVKQTGEVFTPRTLIREMLDKLPNEVWFDPNKTWLEPAAGDGNFLVEVKARLLQAGHDERHVLENMLFSIELIDDNHWTLQHRLGYLVDGKPNPKFWPNEKPRRGNRRQGTSFVIAKTHPLTRELNDANPYHERGNLRRDEVLHHRNHVCWSGLEYNMSFNRAEGEQAQRLPLVRARRLGAWPDTDTPDVGERYVVERNDEPMPHSRRPAQLELRLA